MPFIDTVKRNIKWYTQNFQQLENLEIVFINICNPTEPAYIETFPNLEIPQLSNIDASQCHPSASWRNL